MLPDFSDSESDGEDDGIPSAPSPVPTQTQLVGAMSKYLEMQLPNATELNFKLRAYSACLQPADVTQRSPLYQPSVAQLNAAMSMCALIREHVTELVHNVVTVEPTKGVI